MVSDETTLRGAPGWDVSRYLEYADLRLRPALELLARIPDRHPKRIVDLGCGAGNVTRHLAERWPQAEITGVDNSPEMLARAMGEVPGVNWLEGDLATWAPGQPVDLIYSNAALHWVSNHEVLLPRLLEFLTPDGVLAIQMPNNFNAPSHRLMFHVAAQEPWATQLAKVQRKSPVAAPAFYYDLLAPRVFNLDIWETDYMQVMTGEHPVAEFTKGTWLKPILDALDEPDRTEFEKSYREAVRTAYPPRADGRTLFPFRRLFLLACLGDTE